MRRSARVLGKLLEKQFDATRQDIPAGNIENQLIPGPQGPLPPGGNTGDGYSPADHDHTAAGDGGKLTAPVFDSYSVYEEVSAPSSPASNTLRLYAKDKAGVTELFYKNSGGTERDLSSTGGGSGLPWFNVVDYGAVGDGSTDDTAAIGSAITDLVAAGGGVLYFPGLGTYKTSGGFTLSVPCMVLGDGCAEPNAATWVSAVQCTSQTATLFEIAHDGITFSKIHLGNTYVGTPSAGASITSTTGDGTRLLDCSFRGFWIDVDFQDGAEQYLENCFFYGPVKYGLKIRHVDLPDGGDCGIVNCQFIAKDYNSDAAIRQESAGGLRMVGCKINERGGNKFAYGIDVAIGSGINTSILLITGCSLENVASGAIRVAATGGGTFGFIDISGSQFGMYGITAPAITVSAATIGDIRHLCVVGCEFKAGSSTGNPAISATNIDLVTVVPGTIENYADMLSTSGCTNVIDLSGSTDPAVGGDLSGTASAATVIKLQGRAVSSSAPATADRLRWSSTQWAPSGLIWQPVAVGGELVFAGDDLVLAEA